MMEIMKIMETSFKRSHAGSGTLSAPNPAAGHHRPTPPLEVFWTLMGMSGLVLVGSLLLFPGSWCAHGFVFALQESVSPVPCKFW